MPRSTSLAPSSLMAVLLAAIMIVFAACRDGQEGDAQSHVDSTWRQYIEDVAGSQPGTPTHDGVHCEWMRDVLADRTPSIVFTPGATAVPVDGGWPSKKVAGEYLTELC